LLSGAKGSEIPDLVEIDIDKYSKEKKKGGPGRDAAILNRWLKETSL
jgi:hypothetical protein